MYVVKMMFETVVKPFFDAKVSIIFESVRLFCEISENETQILGSGQNLGIDIMRFLYMARKILRDAILDGR